MVSKGDCTTLRARVSFPVLVRRTPLPFENMYGNIWKLPPFLTTLPHVRDRLSSG